MSRKTFKVLTLNCWALPSDYLPCKFRKERIAAIGKELATGKYDIVLLQEIWHQSDFEKLVSATIEVLKYSHYFHSGMIGSGLCVFSKFPIAETFQRRYSLNGYPHRYQHGDWFGGKAVGLAQILMDEFKLNVYVTHTHADYEASMKTEYRGQRIVQAYELSQFIKHTSHNCDAVIVGGDLNLRPEDLGYKMVISNGNLCDSWISQADKPESEEEGCTSNHKDCTFGNPIHMKRIDYLLYRNNAGYEMVCEKCRVCMGRIPGEDFSYSDHMAVESTFQIRKNITGMAPERDTKSFKNQIPEALDYLDKGIEKVYRDTRSYYIVALVCILVLLLSANLVLPFGLNFVLALYRTMGTLLAGYALVNAIILSKVELNGLISTKKDLERLAKSPE